MTDLSLRSCFALLGSLLVVVGLLVGMIAPAMAQALPALKITGVVFDPESYRLQLSGNRGDRLTYAKHYSVLRQRHPDRVVLDIKEAELGAPAGGMLIDREGIKTLDVQPLQTPFYKAVRITIFVDNKKTLRKVANTLTDNPVVVAYDSSAPGTTTASKTSPSTASQAGTSSLAKKDLSLPVARNVIHNIYFKDGMLYLEGQAQSRLNLKKRMVLESPSRLIIDLEDASVENKGLLNPISTNDPDVRTIRVGQFDDKTVRLVFETPFPDRFYASYPGQNKSLLAIGTHFTHSVSTLPSNVQLGQLEGITLDHKANGEPVLRVTTSIPMVQEVSRDDNRIYIDLSNIAARPGWVSFDKKEFPQIDFMRVESLSADQPNSKLVIGLKSRNTDISAQLYNQGKTLDLLLGGAAAASSTLTITGNRDSNRDVPSNRALYNATVVVDAGHGGKDMGANRAGILEKDLNLSVAHKLRKALEDRGVRVVMTRTTDEFLPLPRISQIANDNNPEVFVSIHTNASTNNAIHGLETYYYTYHSKPLADIVHGKLVNALNVPDRGVRRAMFYVVHHTRAPSILCEMGYISNANERESLTSEWRQNKTAQAIADGVVTYLNRRLSAQAKPKTQAAGIK